MFDINQLFKNVKHLKAADFRLRAISPIQEDALVIEIFDKLGTSDLPIIPVIDKKGQYIGIITLRDLMFLFQRKHTSIHEVFSHSHTFDKYTAGEIININLPIISNN